MKLKTKKGSIINSDFILPIQIYDNLWGKCKSFAIATVEALNVFLLASRETENKKKKGI